jgi:hypothetical protein
MQEKGVWPFTTLLVLEDRKRHLLELATAYPRQYTYPRIINCTTMKQTRDAAQSVSKSDGGSYTWCACWCRRDGRLLSACSDDL